MDLSNKKIDWFKRGVWIACDKQGNPLLLTVSPTPRGCVERLCRDRNQPWSVLMTQGWQVAEFSRKI